MAYGAGIKAALQSHGISVAVWHQRISAAASWHAAAPACAAYARSDVLIVWWWWRLIIFEHDGVVMRALAAHRNQQQHGVKRKRQRSKRHSWSMMLAQVYDAVRRMRGGMAYQRAASSG